MVTDCHHLGVITGVTMSVLVIFIVILFLVFIAIVAVSRKTKSIMRILRLHLDELQNKEYNVLQLGPPSSCTANQEQHLVSPLENKLSQNEPEYAPVQQQNRENLSVIQNVAYGNNSKTVFK